MDNFVWLKDCDVKRITLGVLYSPHDMLPPPLKLGTLGSSTNTLGTHVPGDLFIAGKKGDLEPLRHYSFFVSFFSFFSDGPGAARTEEPVCVCERGVWAGSVKDGADFA